MRGLSRLTAAATLGALLSSAAAAHHSQSEFDLRGKVEVQGTVSKLEWKSPHARLYVDAKNDKGEIVSWNFELPSPNTLMRRGWKRDSLQVGDHVQVTGAPARNFADIAIATFIKDAAGRALFTGTTQVYDAEAAPKANE